MGETGRPSCERARRRGPYSGVREHVETHRRREGGDVRFTSSDLIEWSFAVGLSLLILSVFGYCAVEPFLR